MKSVVVPPALPWRPAGAAALLIGLFCLGPATAQDLLGERLKLTGRWQGEYLRVERLQIRDPRKNPETGQIEGRLDGVEPETRRVRLGPLWVAWDDATRFEGLTPADLVPGQGVKLRVRMAATGRLHATLIRVRAEMDDRLVVLGAVTRSRSLDDRTLQVVVLGLPARLPSALYRPASPLTRRLDDKRPEQQLTVDVFGRPLTLGKSRWFRARKAASIPTSMGSCGCSAGSSGPGTSAIAWKAFGSTTMTIPIVTRSGRSWPATAGMPATPGSSGLAFGPWGV